jgi:hypothetical protein
MAWGGGSLSSEQPFMRMMATARPASPSGTRPAEIMVYFDGAHFTMTPAEARHVIEVLALPLAILDGAHPVQTS